MYDYPAEKYCLSEEDIKLVQQQNSDLTAIAIENDISLLDAYAVYKKTFAEPIVFMEDVDKAAYSPYGDYETMDYLDVRTFVDESSGAYFDYVVECQELKASTRNSWWRN